MKAFLLLVLSLSCCTSALAATDDEAAATAAAESWVKLIDAGDYGKAWEQSSRLLRKRMTKTTWIDAVGQVRRPLGAVISRHAVRTTYATQLPGVPDGQYVVVEFETRFEHKQQAIETITPMRDHDAWKVSGYFIR